MRIVLNFEGESAEEVLAQVRAFAGSGGAIAAPMTAAPAPAATEKEKKNTASGGAKALTEKDVRAAWDSKKGEGHDVSELKAIHVKHGAQSFATLKPEHYAAAIADIQALTKGGTAAITEEDVRKAWAIKKGEGHDVSELKAVNAKYGAQNFATLKPEHYAAAIADIEALTK